MSVFLCSSFPIYLIEVSSLHFSNRVVVEVLTSHRWSCLRRCSLRYAPCFAVPFRPLLGTPRTFRTYLSTTILCQYMSVFDLPSPYLLLLSLEYCSIDVLLSFTISKRVNLYGCDMGAAVHSYHSQVYGRNGHSLPLNFQRRILASRVSTRLQLRISSRSDLQTHPF